MEHLDDVVDEEEGEDVVDVEEEEDENLVAVVVDTLGFEEVDIDLKEYCIVVAVHAFAVVEEVVDVVDMFEEEVHCTDLEEEGYCAAVEGEVEHMHLVETASWREDLVEHLRNQGEGESNERERERGVF